MYYIVYCGVSSYFKLDPIETVVLSFVCSFHRKNKLCYASKDLIAKIAVATPPTVFKALKKLKERGLIVQSTQKGKVCLTLGLEAVDRWKYVDTMINRSKTERHTNKKDMWPV
ncbi:MAG: helix-turn-helix domain-containing protein [Candidatus Taylorbacteria bacterium]